MNFELFVKNLPSAMRYNLVDTLLSIQAEHQGWLNQVCQIISTKTQSLSPMIEDTDAEDKCGFGRWVQQLRQHGLTTDPALNVLLKHHINMHKSARDVNTNLRSGSDSQIRFESFLIEQYHFNQALAKLIACASNHNALYGLKSDLLKATHINDVIVHAQDSLRELPKAEQQGCLAIIGIANIADAQRRFTPNIAEVFNDMLAQRLTRTMRHSDRAVEFKDNRVLVVFPGMPSANARSIMERILDTIQSNPFSYLNDKFSFELACGVTSLSINSFGNECVERAEFAYNTALSKGERLELNVV